MISNNHRIHFWREGARSGATNGTKGASDTFVAPHWGASSLTLARTLPPGRRRSVGSRLR